MWEKLKRFTTTSASQLLEREDDFNPLQLWTDDELMVCLIMFIIIIIIIIMIIIIMIIIIIKYYNYYNY